MADLRGADGEGRVSIDEHGAIIAYSDANISVDLTVDPNGMIIDFPNRARRI